MENHPIPQDVTGFQFKLIGNMTVKQFAYLATGVVFAGILWQLPVNILIKFPLCAFLAILGIGLAYFPVSGRPMDTMIGNYIKAMLRPTQFIYEKVGGQIYFPNNTPFTAARITQQYKNDFSPFPKDKLKAYLESLGAKAKNKVDEKEDSFLTSVSNLAANASSYQPVITPQVNAVQMHSQVNPVADNLSPKPLVEQGRAEPKPSVAAPAVATIGQPTRPTDQREASPAFAATKIESKINEQVKTVRPILKGFNKAIGTLSAPDFPNLITGITKDPRGNALSNILVEVKDKEGNPVRAFKTNEVGRFASATPLTNGSYTVEFEDPKAQNKFEKITMNVVGQIISPVEAISIDTREELRRSLFSIGGQPN